MEDRSMSIQGFMGALVPSGQLSRHTRELLRTLESEGVRVVLPSRACACLTAHTEREIDIAMNDEFLCNEGFFLAAIGEAPEPEVVSGTVRADVPMTATECRINIANYCASVREVVDIDHGRFVVERKR